MSRYERFALVLDSETSDLGRTAIRLLELGVDVLYANDPDEAALLASQESPRLGAVLAPTSLAAGLPAVLDRVCRHLEGGARCLIPTGLEPPPALSRELRERGVEWRLWEPYEEPELRFVVTAAMSRDHGGERRKHPRIPTEIETAVYAGRDRKQVVVRNLSAGGAFLACPQPFPERSRVSIEISLPGGRIAGYAEVVKAWDAPPADRTDLPRGMAVAFTQLTPRSEELVRSHVTGWIERFRL